LTTPGLEVQCVTGSAKVGEDHVASHKHNYFASSGREIAADYKGIRLIHVCAPPGTAKRANREQFYTAELPYLLHDGLTDLFTGGGGG